MSLLIHDSSLGLTLAAANDHLPADCELNTKARSDLIGWILDRQIRSGSHRGLFEPLRLDDPESARTVTGERLRTRLGIQHIVTQEAARLLWMLGFDRSDVRDAVQLANARMSKACYALHHCVIGECAHSSIGYLRFQGTAHPWQHPPWIHRHLSVIRSLRDGKGRWNRLPFYYTLLCLHELDHEWADVELRYAAPACARVAHRRQPDEAFGRRRTKLIESILATDSMSLDSSLELFDEGDGSNRRSFQPSNS